jgi:hypothetical protein
MHLSDNFRLALWDYVLLLEKKYPEKAIHELVSTRYALNHFERSMLYRGIAPKSKADARRTRLITIEQLNNRTLYIDLFNALFTIAAYLRGFPVYLSNDGLLRDASEGHDSHEWVQHLEQALSLLLEYIDGLGLARAVFYLDNPLHLSSYVAKEIEKKSTDLKLKSEIISHESPDHLIRNASDGILATSDSTIIDRSALPVLDLPKHLLGHKFNPHFIDIRDYI